ncbi:MAG: cysteine hydrolase [Rhizobiales bacterium]|nr:cysteine hydrolase [Hyphomicrobiales bacterium]
MQNAYLSEKGSFARLWPESNNREVKPLDPAGGLQAAADQFDLALLRRAIPHCKRLVESARRAGVPVIFVQYVYRSDYKDGGVLIQKISPSRKDVGYIAEGSWDADFIDELKPLESDFIVKKARFSAFHATTLETVLRSLGAETLVVCGVTTHVCVETTARDGHMRDYQVIIASDATDEVNELWKQTALASFSAVFGWVLTVDEITAVWDAIEPLRKAG